MIIALPPSEGKTAPQAACAQPAPLEELTFAELTDARAEIGRALASLGTGTAAQEILTVGPKAAAELAWNLAHGAGRYPGDAAPAASSGDAVPALFGAPAHTIYTGVLFAAAKLGVPHSTDAEIPARTTSATPASPCPVWIFSGRYGVVQPGDVIAPYRLPAAAKLPGIGPVASWWKPRLTPVLDAATTGHRLVLDCRSGPYQRMWTVPAPLTRLEVKAARERAGKRTVISHMAKHYRGELTRLLLTSGQDFRDPSLVAAVARAGGLTVELDDAGPRHVILTVVAQG